ncbi:MAG TPA: hypothetical protein VN723_13255 [Rhizomicrobium sp.]|jgi:hypothetical protein|nr:hypothetical protein [Rhizomicrobium sp.]
MVSQLTEKIAHIPQAYEHQDKSTASLLEEAGLPGHREELSVEEVEQVLREEPDLARLWLGRGGDQRFSGGWGIERTGREYKLLNFADGGSLSFRDRAHAVAEFAVRYIRFIDEMRRH